MDRQQSGRDGEVVVGVDGSPNSIAALRRAARQARRRLSELMIVYVIPVGSGAVEAEAAGDTLSGAVQAAFPDGLRMAAGRRVERGEPAKVLVWLSRRAELLVIGSRTSPTHDHILGGPTVSHCLDYAYCPVDICADHGPRMA
jgi:nucleotide-binding universal stress UspA family protein